MQNGRFGLLGKTLKHSYSKGIHQKLGSYSYELIEIPPESLKDFVINGEFDGFNVTIPYKKDIIAFLDEVHSATSEIGAVNTVVKRDGKLFGYNTDFDGMCYTVNRAGIDIKDKVVAILGTGGTSNTAKAVCKSLGAKQILIVSRSGDLNYDNVYEKQEIDVVVNTTPVGMYPQTESSPIDLARLKNISGVIDVVYNPFVTKLIEQAKSLGIKCADGLPMLVAQAKYASEKFTGSFIPDSVIEEIVRDLRKEKLNVVLIGMPGSGKSTLGKLIASQLNKEFIDIDQAIVERVKMSIPEFFEKFGEAEFRKVEKQLCVEIGKESGKVIATGGGVVKDRANRFSLRQNGRIYYLSRALEKLSLEGRPLSKDRKTVEKLYQERKSAYEFFADVIIDNNGQIQSALKGVLEDYENFSY